MSEMVERVARAIRKASATDTGGSAGKIKFAARAAIEAMREPTEAMLAATDGMDIMWEYHWQGGKPGSPADVWRAMIDRALTDE